MMSTSLPDGVATCSTSLPVEVVADRMRAPGARVMVAAAPAWTWAGATPRACSLAAMKTWAWRIKPQMVPKSASTKSVLMIMTITQAVRRLVAGGGTWTGMSDTDNSLSKQRTALADQEHAG